ncbi:MAG: hydroxymethylbilane synthase [Desulfobacteraceae bacterium]|nr:hydroxymethylbilane synthase [Desulfobacteraceae bacterium]
MILKIGTRGSKLALAQSRWVKEEVEARHSHVQVELVRIRTKGDKIIDSPLSKLGGKGLFVKEIEDALLRRQVHVAVHSMKDVPSELPGELTLSVFPCREDPSDALISEEDRTLEELPRGARVGTSSLRRAAQLLHIRPDLEVVALRGNVDTRLKKLDSGDLHAIILATAGLKRLGFAHRISEILPIECILPAIGQGALGLELRRDDEETLDLLEFLNHEPTQKTVTCERAFLKELEGGCQVPIAGFARIDEKSLHLRGLVAELDGSTLIRDEITGENEKAEEIGIALAKRLLDSGADKILERVYGRCDS